MVPQAVRNVRFLYHQPQLQTILKVSNLTTLLMRTAALNGMKPTIKLLIKQQ